MILDILTMNYQAESHQTIMIIMIIMTEAIISKINFDYGVSNDNNNVDYYLINLPHVPSFKPTNAVVENPIIKKVCVLDGQTEEGKQQIELSSELKLFFSKALETLSAKNEITISADLKQMSEGLRKGKTSIDLKFFYREENPDFKNRPKLQALDNDMEKTAEILTKQECAKVLRQKTKFRYISRLETFRKSKQWRKHL